MSAAIAWLVANWGLIIEALAALVAAASVITGLTETPKDDNVVSWIRKALGWVSAVTHKDAPGTYSAPFAQPGDEPLMFKRASRK